MFDLNFVNSFVEKVESSQYKNGEMTGTAYKTGVDLGTAYIVLTVLDNNNNPIACEKVFSQFLKDGVVVDYYGALKVLQGLKSKLESRIGCELIKACIAMPADTESSTKTHQYIVESAGFEVTNILDEPTAANSVYNIKNGLVVDIGGGTTGIAIFKNGKVVKVYDEPTGGTHFSLVLSGRYKISFEEAEKMKMNKNNHKEILTVVKPTVEKMAEIVLKGCKGYDVEYVYLCGGTCCLSNIEDIFYNYTGIKTIKPNNPFLVTPAGIAMNCLI